MRSYKIITLLAFIASSIAGGTSENKAPHVVAPHNHVQCGGNTLYSIRELQTAAVAGCRSASRIHRCGVAGKCQLVKNYFAPQEYKGDGFGQSRYKKYLWKLPERERSAFEYSVVFDFNPKHQNCLVYGAVYKNKSSQSYALCGELGIPTVPEPSRGRSKTRYKHLNLDEVYPAEEDVSNRSRDNSKSRGNDGSKPEEISQTGPSVKSPRLPTSGEGLSK